MMRNRQHESSSAGQTLPHEEALPEQPSTDISNLKGEANSQNLQESATDRYKTLFGSIDEGFCVVELLFDEAGRPVDYRFLEINPAFERQTGLRNAQGKRMRELASAHEEHWFEIYGKVALTGESVRFEKEARQLHRWYEVCAFRVGKPADKQVGILFKDITERKRAEEALRESEAHFRALVEQAPFSVQLFSADGMTLRVNRAWEELWGVSQERIKDYNVLHDAQLEEKGVLPFLRRAFAGEAVQIPAIMYDPNETIPGRTMNNEPQRWVAAVAYPIHDQAGRVREVVLIHEDITERKRAEERARLFAAQCVSATAKFRAVFEQSPIFAGMMTVDGVVIDANRLALEACGYTEEQVIGRLFWNTPWWRNSPEIQDQLQAGTQQAAGGEAYQAVLPYWWADGSQRLVELTIHPIRDNEQRIILLYPSGVDITTRQRASARAEFLSRLAQKLSTEVDPHEINRIATAEVGEFLNAERCYFFQGLPEKNRVQVLPDWHRGEGLRMEGVYEMERFGRPEWWEAVQKGPISVDDVSAHSWTKDFTENYQKLGVTSYCVAPFIHQGSWVAAICLASSRPRHWSVNDLGLLEDVVARVWPLIERARTEEALREGEERFRALADNMAQLAWMTDSSGKIFWYNQRWYDFTGTTLEQMQREGWALVHHPDYHEAVAKTWSEALKTGSPWQNTFPLRGKDGSFHWFLSRALPIRDLHGAITKWFGTNTDITEQRETQVALQVAQEELQRQNQALESTVQERTRKLMEALAELEAYSYSVAHDMRAPLRGMQGFAEVLLEDYSSQLDATAQQYLRRISNSAERMDRLIQDVLSYSKIIGGELRLESVDTGNLLRDIIQTYSNLQTPKVEIKLEGKLPTVMANLAALTQVFSNLLGNAAKFVAPGVTPKINVRAEDRGDRVRLWFEDNGIGIDASGQKRIFGLFERLHRPDTYEGTGLGLAIVRKAVERMGGEVGVISEGGHGSRFWIELLKGNSGEP
ncbi:MAG TPA: PAS domain S-box protein [Candidatus Saccharimonadales bacterium]|nr:PAS domain S-box protein [Candidatus Saccharimonadales bacterium]